MKSALFAHDCLASNPNKKMPKNASELISNVFCYKMNIKICI